MQKEGIYIPGCTVGVGYSFKGLKVDFAGIYKRKLAKILTPTENIFNTKIETIAFSPKDFEINKQIETENFINRTQFVQDSYFLYTKCNIIKKNFVTELNKFIFIYGSVSYIGKKSLMNRQK